MKCTFLLLGFPFLMASGQVNNPVTKPVAWGDIVISEVMFDPEPAVHTSLGEYVELLNSSAEQVNVEGWSLVSGQRTFALSDTGFFLGPGSYFVRRGIVLPNEGTTLALYNSDGALVHAARYGVPFRAPEWKKAGGWSIESPDPHQPCITSGIWEYSRDPSGGTPGRVNSCDRAIEDREPPMFLYAGFGEGPGMELHFSEIIDLGEFNDHQVMIRPGNLRADTVWKSTPLGDRLICSFPRDPSAIPGFTLSLPGVPDCLGNRGKELDIHAGRVTEPQYGSLVINEIMYDPQVGKSEFIELYHPGPGYIDLEDLSLGMAAAGESPDRLHPLSPQSHILGPGALVVISGDNEQVKDSYGLELSGALVEMHEMPALQNGGGWIYLSDRSGNTIDLAAYHDGMHMDMVDDPSGISLERISHEWSGLPASSWHSAGSLQGYSTPGRMNSQAIDGRTGTGLLEVNPKVFSPNNDGYHDQLEISVCTGESGGVLSLWIFDMKGILVKELANNHIIGPCSVYSWKGLDNHGQSVLEGFYIVQLRTYSPGNGQIRNRRLAVGLVYR